MDNDNTGHKGTEISPLAGMYPEETLMLIDGYMQGIGTEHDRKARERIFADFHNITGRDLIHAEVSAFHAYAAELKNRLSAGKIKLNTALQYQRVLSAFASYCLREKAKGNPSVPQGYEDRSIPARIAELPEAIYFRDIPSMQEMDDLIGYINGRGDIKTLAVVLLAFKCFFKTGEIAGIRKRDIVTDGEGFTYVFSEKGMPVRIPEDVASVLDRCLADIPEDGCPFSKRGKPLTLAAIQKRVRIACRNAGIGEYSLNSLRNAGTVAAVAGGADAVKLCDDMRYRNRAHIRRLTSLPLTFADVTGYVHIEVKDTRSPVMRYR